MAGTYKPPANLTDFDKAESPSQLYEHWHRLMQRFVESNSGAFPAAFDALDPPAADGPVGAAPEWTGLPRTVKRIAGPSVAAAAEMVEEAVRMGDFDPLVQGMFTIPFRDRAGRVFRGPAYRPQDEYLEWVTRRDADGVVTEVIFTAEGPEYWEALATDSKLLESLYQDLCQNTSIKADDLVFPKDLFWDNPNSSDGERLYRRGSYNPYNRWNVAHAVHLTQTANTLGAEIQLAKEATLLFGTPPLTSDPELVCCAGYGGINRMSDPTIGAGVNALVRGGGRVALRNPIGLYIKELQPNVFTLDGAPFMDQEACWEVIRPEPANVTDMIVRARFRVPEGLMHKGRQLRVGDLAYQGEPVAFGGQIADAVTMTLYALAIPGAPLQEPQQCRSSPCPHPKFPDFVVTVPFGDPCPTVPSVAAIAAADVEGEMETIPMKDALALLREQTSQRTTSRVVLR